MKTKILASTILSLSLLTGTVFADSSCTGDHCFIKLSKVAPTKKLTVNKSDSFKSEDVIKIILEEDKTNQEEEADFMAFPPETYIATKEEIKNLTIIPTDVENEFLNKVGLPVSQHFCANHTKPIYNGNSKTYECA